MTTKSISGVVCVIVVAVLSAFIAYKQNMFSFSPIVAPVSQATTSVTANTPNTVGTNAPTSTAVSTTATVATATSTQNDGKSNNMPPKQVPKFFYGTIRGVASNIQTTAATETQYKVLVFQDWVPLIGQNVIVSSLNCSQLDAVYSTTVLYLYTFNGVTYDSEHGWYHCTSATRSPLFGGDQ